MGSIRVRAICLLMVFAMNIYCCLNRLFVNDS